MPSPISCFFISTSKFWKSLGALSERRIVGKPQILSRLRYVNIVERPDETEQERLYRSQYDSLQEWNNKYWAENNELFNREKAKYIADNFGVVATEEQALSHDQLASFYREFLERNRDKHVEYNRIWYKNHIALLLSSTSAKLSRLKANLHRYNEINKNH